MVTINFTIVFEIVSFLAFLWVANTFMIAPLRALMERREAKLASEKAAADHALAEAERIDAEYTAKLTEAHQAVAQELRQARQDAYQRHRAEMDARRHKADAELAEFRARVAQRLDDERRRYPELVSGLVEAIDERIRMEGTVR